MDWLILVTGAPRIPDYSGWEEWSALPRPLDFFQALFSELAGITLNTRTVTYEYVEPRELQIVEAFYGNEQVGLRSREQISLYSSMFPQLVKEETYGLAELEISWAYEWVKSGHGYYFRHRELRARFDNDEVRGVFGRIWHAVFGTEPAFEAVGGNNGQPAG